MAILTDASHPSAEFGRLRHIVKFATYTIRLLRLVWLVAILPISALQRAHGEAGSVPASR